MFYSVLIGIAVLTLFIWEHIARKRFSNFKPSVGFWKLYYPLKYLFLWVGNKVAELSSFYTYLKKFIGAVFDILFDFLNWFFTNLANVLKQIWSTFKTFFGTIFDKLTYYAYKLLTGFLDFVVEFLISGRDLLTPLLKICITPLYFFRGYFETAMTYKYSILVFLGTVTISYGLYYMYGYVW